MSQANYLIGTAIAPSFLSLVEISYRNNNPDFTQHSTMFIYLSMYSVDATSKAFVVTSMYKSLYL